MNKIISTSIIAIAAANFIVACSREQQPPPESTTTKDASKDRDQNKSEPDAATAPADPTKSGY